MPVPALLVAAVRAKVAKRAAAVVAGLALPAGMVVVLLSPPAQDAEAALSGCGGGDVVQVSDVAAVPGFTEEQTKIAETILSVAGGLGVPDRGVIVAYATALQESGMRNLDYGDADSLGVFQQRPSADWGTPEQVTDPVYSATAFFKGAGTNPGLLQVRGWQEMSVAEAAQAVQRSAFPDAYAAHEDDAARLLAALTGTVTPCSPVTAGGIGEPPAPYTGGATGCVISDPTGRAGGCVTGAMLWVTQQIGAHLGPWPWGIGCWDEHAWNPTSDHPQGKACDYMVGTGGTFPDEVKKAKGDELAAWLTTFAGELSIRYVIWQGRIWQPGHGWKPYSGGGVYDPSDATGGHYDHVHISVTM